MPSTMMSLFSVGGLFLLCALAPMIARSASPAGTDFDSFFGAFKAAIARRDAKAVAELTQLPFLFNSKPRDRAEFQKFYPELFDAKVRACFSKAKVIRGQDAWEIYCGRYIFYFRVVHRQYRFVEFAADPEAAP